MEKLDKPTFNFKFTSYEETEREVNKLKIKKAPQKSDIPLKISTSNRMVSSAVNDKFDEW